MVAPKLLEAIVGCIVEVYVDRIGNVEGNLSKALKQSKVVDLFGIQNVEIRNIGIDVRIFVDEQQLVNQMV